MFTEYSVTTGMRIYDDDMTTFETIIDESSFTYTLAEPTYEFGDEFEFDERPYDESIFTMSNNFEMSDYVEGADGVGFQVVQGLFKAIPNFETTMWIFKFALEMPDSYFDSGAYVFNWATYQDVNQEMQPVTVACGITVGDPYSAEVFQYDETFDSSTDVDKPAPEGNSDAKVNNQDYSKTPDIEEVGLLPSLNGNVRQACNVRVEVPPDEAAAFFDRSYTLTLGGRLYESRDSTVYHELPALTDSFDIPAPDFTFEPLEEVIMDTQIVAEEEFGVDAADYLGVDTTVKQLFYAGFETNPNDETVNDFLGFQFELESPSTEVFKFGSIIYQWATYVKSDDYSSDPITIGCATKVGDPYTAEVQTFEGTSSMSADSAKVANRTYTGQNVDEKAGLKESFGITQDLAWYDSYERDGSMVQPCRAVIEYDGKLNSTNAIFGTYNITLGSRIYANATSTDPQALPDQSFQVEFTMPETDLSVLYEEDVPEEQAAYVVYLQDKFRRKVVATWSDWAGSEKFYWLKVEGGYKLYGASGAADRWYFKLGIERPTSMFTDDEIVYFWLTWFDEMQTNDYTTGAIGCKVTTGSPQKTSVDQWKGETDLSKDSTGVYGKKWKNQQKEGKMAKADYYAKTWDATLYEIQASDRKSGQYSTQWCEVEVRLEDIDFPSDITLEMQMGARFYTSNTDTAPISTREPSFDWYREEMTFSDELKEEPVYEDPQEKKQAEEIFEFTVEDVFAAFMDAYNAYIDQLIADAEAAAAEAAAAEDSTSSDTAETSTAMVMGMRNRQETTTSTDISASQTYSNGFSTYEGLTASDWWVWTLAVDMPENMIGDDYILYQWATLIDQETAETFSIGCKRTMGDDLTFAVDVYTQDSTSQEALYPDNAEVVDKTWDAQAPDYKEEEEDHVWQATSAYTTLVGDSETTNNKIYACYLAKELPKIGRNPADFDKTYTVHLGARLYESDSATTFTEIPMVSSSFEYPEPPSYAVAATEGAFALFASTMAAIAVLFMAF